MFKILLSLFLIVLGLAPALYAQFLKPDLVANFPEFVWGSSALFVTVSVILGWRVSGLATQAAEATERLTKAEEEAAKFKGQLADRSETINTLKKDLTRLEELDKSQRQRFESSKRELANAQAVTKKLDGASAAALQALGQVTQAQTTSFKALEGRVAQSGETLMTQLDDLLSSYDQTRLGLEAFVNNLNLNFDGIKGHAEELGDLCRRFEELRLNNKEEDYGKSLEVIAANLGLTQDSTSSEDSYSHRLQVIGLNLKNRDASQRLLVSKLEHQGTEVVLRTEAALRTLRSRVEEIVAFQATHATVSSQMKQLRFALGQQNGQLVKSCKELGASGTQSIGQIQEQLNLMSAQLAELSTGSKGA